MLTVFLCIIVPLGAGLSVWYAFSSKDEPVDSLSSAIPSIDVRLYESVSSTFLDRVPSGELSDFSASSSDTGSYTYGRNDPFR